MIITFLVADACEVVAFGGHRISLEVAGVALLILGFLGMIFSTYVLHMPQRCLPLRPTDEELFSPAILGDGEALHTAVGQNMWCVNLEDLRQLRRLVMHAVARGTVRPTDRDSIAFDWFRSDVLDVLPRFAFSCFWILEKNFLGGTLMHALGCLGLQLPHWEGPSVYTQEIHLT